MINTSDIKNNTIRLVISATKKEIKSAEDIHPKPVSIDEVVVCFVAVENGDDDNVALDAISQIKESMEKKRMEQIIMKIWYSDWTT